MKTITLQSLAVGLFAAITMTACAEIPLEEIDGDAIDGDERIAEVSSAETIVPQFGDTMWVIACDHTSVTANWGSKCTRPIEHNSCTYSPPPGWVMLESHVTVWSSNNGWRANQTLAGGLNLASQSTLQNAYNSATNLALSYQNQAIAAQLSDQYTQNEDYRVTHQSSHNVAILDVYAQAHGTCLVDKKRGWEEDSLEVKLLYIGSNNFDTLLNGLRDEYGLWAPILRLNNQGSNPGTINLSANGPIIVKDAAFTTTNYTLSVQRTYSNGTPYGSPIATEVLPLSEGQQIKAGTYPLSTFMNRHPEVILGAGRYYEVKISNNTKVLDDRRLVRLN